MIYYKIVSKSMKSNSNVNYECVQINYGSNSILSGVYVGVTPYDAIRYGKTLFKYEYILLKISSYDYKADSIRKNVGMVYNFKVLEVIDIRDFLHKDMTQEAFYKFTEGVILTSEELNQFKEKINKKLYQSNIQRNKFYPVEVRRQLALELGVKFHR